MKIKYLILNLHLKDIENGGHSQLAQCNKYPGARWLYYVSKACLELGIGILDSESAKDLLLDKEINPDDCALLTEHQDMGMWATLVNSGVKNVIAFCFESPMYAWDYYDRILTNCLPHHTHRFGFPNGGNTTEPIFPSYDKEDIYFGTETRKSKTVAVISNKHYAYMNVNELIKISPSFTQAVMFELHSDRIARIKKHIALDDIDLFGSGWFSEDQFGAKSLNMDPFGVFSLYGKPIKSISNKAELLRKYDYCLAIENVDMLGYCTEKSIEALVNGCIPIMSNHAKHVLNNCGVYKFEDMVPDAQKYLYETELTNPFSHRFMASRVMQELEKM